MEYWQHFLCSNSEKSWLSFVSWPPQLKIITLALSVKLNKETSCNLKTDIVHEDTFFYNLYEPIIPLFILLASFYD